MIEKKILNKDLQYPLVIHVENIDGPDIFFGVFGKNEGDYYDIFQWKSKNII